MATLPEIAEWVNGVYQIEESDPVLGGPPNESTGAGLTNIPALHLAKRTAYLKQVLDDAGIGLTAAPAIADFNLVGASGLYQAASAANAPEPGVPFTLLHIQSSATQATQIASRITSDRVWIRRLAAGTWSAWREILHTGNAATILGNTPAQFDDSTALATTEFVQRALGNHADFIEVATNRTLTAADAGKAFFITGNVTVTLPTSTALTPGVAFRFVLSGGSSVTFAGGSEIVENSGAIHTGAVAGFEVTLHAVASLNQYRMTLAGDGPHSMSSNGYQRLPSGLIIQWGSASVSANSFVDVTLPISFPQAGFSISFIRSADINQPSNRLAVSGFFPNNSTLRLLSATDAPSGTDSYRYLVLGH